MLRRVIDLSHPIEQGMVTYPGLPAPVITTFASRDETVERMTGGVSFHIGAVHMVANTGTYLDAPFHFHADGPDVAGLPADRLAELPATVVQAAAGRAIGPAELPDASVLTGHAVLFHTGHARKWGTEAYFRDAPFLAAEAVEALIAAEPLIVGIDSLNIDDVGDLSRPAHHGLLGAGIPVVEHLTALDQIPGDMPFRFTALPAPVKGMGTFPVRAIAVIG